MLGYEPSRKKFLRYMVGLAAILGMFALLVYGLADLQLSNSDSYQEMASSARTKKIVLRGKRGNITDADSVILAEDQLIYKRESQWRSNNYLAASRYPTAQSCIEKLYDRYQFEAVQPNISEDLMCKVMAIYCEMQMNVFSSQPIVIAKDVNYETVIEVETRSMMLSGMEIAVGTKRVYPRSNLAAQVIGYIGAIPSQSMWQTLSTKGYSYNDTIGRDGIESSMEDWLTQNSSTKSGYRIVERDQRSKVVRELEYVAPQDGNNVKLTLHASYQAIAERAIAENVNDTRNVQEKKLVSDDWLEDNKTDIANRDWEKYPLQLAEHGCLVVLDMKDRVLAMANYPTYDLNALVGAGADAMTILQDPRNLLLNYGIHARGTPGSIFKMVTGYGALNERRAGPHRAHLRYGLFQELQR